MASAVRYLLALIRRGELDEISGYINRDLPIKQLNIHKYYNLLKLALLECQSSQNVAAARKVIESFEMEDYNRPGTLPLLASLFARGDYSNDLLRFISLAFPERSILELSNNYIEWDGGPETRVALIKLFEVYGDAPLNIYRELLHSADTNKNGEAIKFFEVKLREFEEYVNIPSWIKTFPDLLINNRLPDDNNFEELLPEPPTDPEVVESNINEDEIIDYLIGGYNLPVPERNELRGEMQKRLNDPKDRLSLIKDVLLQQQRVAQIHDITVTRLLGPANPSPDDDLTEEGILNAYGGCRMLSSNEYETDEFSEIDNDPPDWFTGNCDFCIKKIRQRIHAVRLPLIPGGWRGCFCSWEHVHDWILWYEDRSIWDLPNFDVGDVNVNASFIEPGENERFSVPSPPSKDKIDPTKKPEVCVTNAREDSSRCEERNPNAWDRLIDWFADRVSEVGIQDREMIIGVRVDPVSDIEEMQFRSIGSLGYREMRVDDIISALPEETRKLLTEPIISPVGLTPLQIVSGGMSGPVISNTPPTPGESENIGGPIGV